MKNYLNKMKTVRSRFALLMYVFDTRALGYAVDRTAGSDVAAAKDY